MRRLIFLLLVGVFALLAAAACTPIDPRAQTDDPMTTGHVDSGGAGGGAM